MDIFESDSINVNVHMKNNIIKKEKYILCDGKDKITVIAPLCIYKEDGSDEISYDNFTFKNGPKANFIKLFFDHKSEHISIKEEHYDLDQFLFGNMKIPEKYLLGLIPYKDVYGYAPFPMKKKKKKSQELYEDIFIEGLFDLSKLLPDSEFVYLDSD